MITPSTIRIWLVTATIVLSFGCGFEAGPSPFDDQQLEDDDNQSQNDQSPTELGTGSGAGTMAGTWLQVHVASSCVFDQEQVSASYYLVDIEIDGAGLSEDRRLCNLELSPVLGSRPVASDEVLASVEFPQVDMGLVSSPAEGGLYASSTAVGLWGIDLDDPVGESVPTEASDDRVVDADGDGNPGVTMEIVGRDCDRYMGQRQITKFYGDFKAPNDIRGSSVRTTETFVYGGSDTACELAPEVEPNDDHSAFRMVRVDGRGGAVDAGDGDDEIECEDVAEYLKDIREIREADDTHCQ